MLEVTVLGILPVDGHGLLVVAVRVVVARVGLGHQQVPRRLGQGRDRGRGLRVVHRREPLHREVCVGHRVVWEKMVDEVVSFCK